jgi:chromosome segregation ATPase
MNESTQQRLYEDLQNRFEALSHSSSLLAESERRARLDLSNVTRNLREASNKLGLCESKKNTLESENALLKEELSTLQTKLSMNEQELKEYSRNLANAVFDSEEYGNIIVEMSNELILARQRLSNALEVGTSNRQEILSISSRLEEIESAHRKEMTKLTNEYDEKIFQLHEQIQHLSNQNEHMKENFFAEKEQFESRMDNIKDNYNSSVKLMKEEMNQLLQTSRSQLELVMSEKDALSQKYDSLKDEHSRSLQRLSKQEELQDALSKSLNKIETLNRSIVELEGEKKSLSKEKDTLSAYSRDAIMVLEKKLARSEERIQLLKEKLELVVTEAEKEAAKDRSKSIELEKQLMVSQKQCLDLQSEKDDAIKRATELAVTLEITTKALNETTLLLEKSGASSSKHSVQNLSLDDRKVHSSSSVPSDHLTLADLDTTTDISNYILQEAKKLQQVTKRLNDSVQGRSLHSSILA